MKEKQPYSLQELQGADERISDGTLKTASPLYWLSANSDGVALLSRMMVANPGLSEQLRGGVEKKGNEDEKPLKGSDPSFFQKFSDREDRGTAERTPRSLGGGN